MPSTPSATPTPITPPRVPLIDQRTGLIDRAWYMFFLSLFQSANSVEDPTLGPSAESLIASYDEALRTLAQYAETLPPAVDYSADIHEIKRSSNTQPSDQTSELQQEVNNLRQEVQTLRQPELGTMAELQQANVPWLTFDSTPDVVPPDVGTVAWDGGTTLGIQMTTNVLQRVGESEYVYAKASSAITKGQLCYHTGAVGASSVITVAPTPLALADPNQIVGVAAESIALNDFGLIQVSGVLRGFNTTGSSVGEVWADGDPLYYNPAYVGGMTKTKPTAPNQKSYIGEVISAGSGGSGSMHIRIVPGSVLGGTDSNVQFGTLANNNLIQYDSTLQYWKNVTASSVSVGTATNLAGGAAGSVPYQTGAGATTFLSIGTAAQVLKVNAGATAPEWVSGAALSKTDDTNVTLTLGGAPTTSLLAATSLTLGWTGQLAVSRGGTGVNTTPTNGQLLIGNGTGYTVANLTAGTGVSISNSAGGISISATGTGGTVTSVSVVSANGFAGTVANATTTPAITISTSITGLLYGNGTALAATTVSSPLSYSAGTLSIPVATSSANGYLSSTDWSTFNAKQPVAAPVTQTANFSVGATDVWTINNKSGSSCVVTLPAAASYSGRVLYFQNYQAQTLVSASSNVVPLAGGAATTAILEAVAGANATLVSNGTNWIMTQYDSNNALQLE